MPDRRSLRRWIVHDALPERAATLRQRFERPVCVDRDGQRELRRVRSLVCGRSGLFERRLHRDMRRSAESLRRRHDNLLRRAADRPHQLWRLRNCL